MSGTDATSSSEHLKQQQAALADFGLFAFRCENVDDLLDRACELVSDALDVPLVKVLEHRPKQSVLFMRGGVNWEPGFVGHETFGDHEKSPGGYALRDEKPVVSPDLEKEDRFDIPDVLRRHGVKSMVNVIIAGDDKAFGVLEVDARQPRDFHEDDIAFLRTYANLLAAAIERVRTHENLRRSAREQGVLARELGHRVRNLLGLIRALASQTSTRDRTADEFRVAFIDRLQALSTAEGLVFSASNERVDPMKLAAEVLSPYRQDDPDKIVMEGPEFGLPARHARMFGLALHELATNAAKYGALSVEYGTVSLTWTIDDAREHQRTLSMVWQEQDGPQITPPERKGFGTRLLEDVVAHELNGEAELNYEPGGLRYCLNFPVEETDHD